MQSFGKKQPPAMFMDDYWSHFEFYENKVKREKFQSVFFPHLPDVIIYGSEISLLQRKLLYHEIGVPVFFKPSSIEDDTDASQYLKWIIFSKQDPKKIFPDIIRRPLGYVPNFITESFYRFGISFPL
jgi:hypothetical protein